MRHDILTKEECDLTRKRLNDLHDRLTNQPPEFKISFQLSIEGILNAYREGDVKFQDAVGLIKNMTQVRNLPPGTIKIKPDETVLKIANYEIILAVTSKGSQLIRRNDGFSGYELLGLLEFIQIEIIQQMAGKIQPDSIIRQFVEQAAAQ